MSILKKKHRFLLYNHLLERVDDAKKHAHFNFFSWNHAKYATGDTGQDAGY